MAPITGCTAHETAVERWHTWRGAKAIRGEHILTAELPLGYIAELHDTGRLYTLRVYYWGSAQDISKEGYMLDFRCTGSDWATVRSRALDRGVTRAALATVESESDDEDIALR